MSETGIDGAEKLRKTAFAHLRAAERHRDALDLDADNERLVMALDALLGAVQCLTEWSTHSHPDRPKDNRLRAVPDPGTDSEGEVDHGE